jgi:hypothetical protein
MSMLAAAVAMSRHNILGGFQVGRLWGADPPLAATATQNSVSLLTDAPLLNRSIPQLLQDFLVPTG